MTSPASALRIARVRSKEDVNHGAEIQIVPRDHGRSEAPRGSVSSVAHVEVVSPKSGSEERKPSAPTRETGDIVNNWKWGGVAALIAAATVVVGLGLFATVVADYASGDLDPGESVAFLVDNQAVLYVWNAITLIGFSVVLVPLALALNRRLKAGSRALAPTATAFALIWAGLLMAAGMVINIGSGTVADLAGTEAAQAETVWLTVDTVGNGLSGGMEIAGPLWVLLISVAALSSGALPRPLNYVGIVIAAAGLLTIVPALELIGALFGLGLIVWLTWLGIVMLRDDATQPV